jgi:glucose/mannose-6-phosphate isomerase
MKIIKNFKKQFDYKPTIRNRDKLKKSKDFFVAGMGGSHLSADIIRDIFPELNIQVHSDYGLPRKINKESLLILSSFSGNTEEVLDTCY